MSTSLNHKSIILIFFVVAFLERTVFDLGPNVELITISMLLASIYLPRNTAFKSVFLVMAASDLIIGNTNILLFTWTGFLIPVVLISKFKHLLNIENHRVRITTPLLLGLSSNLFFYLWTNFGVWFLDNWGMYSKTLPGLIHCYINGLPFFRNQLESTLVFVPLGFLIFNWLQIRLISKSWNLSLQSR